MRELSGLISLHIWLGFFYHQQDGKINMKCITIRLRKYMLFPMPILKKSWPWFVDQMQLFSRKNLGQN